MLGNPNSIIDVDVPVEGPTVSVITQLCRGRRSDCFGPMRTSAATVLNGAGAALRTLCVSLKSRSNGATPVEGPENRLY
jgi:hypothetical protein